MQVPAGSVSLYQAAAQWQDFNTIIEVQTTATTTSNSATITWAAVSGATSYDLKVYLDAAHTQLFGDYVLNASGQRQNAPSQNAPMRSAQATAATQLSYTVTGLSPQTQYWYVITASDNTTYGGTFITQSPTGIETITTEELRIYPNPVRDELRIENGELRIYKVEICDLSGKMVNSQWLNGKSINVSNLSQGIYIVRITTDKGTVTRKFVKE